MSNFVQGMIDAGNVKVQFELLAAGFRAEQLEGSFDEVLNANPEILQKKISIKDTKALIEENLLTKSVEQYQESGVTKKGAVGGGGTRKAATPYFLEITLKDEDGNETGETAKVYPTLYFQGSKGVARDEQQKAFATEFQNLLEAYCQKDEAPVSDEPAEAEPVDAEVPEQPEAPIYEEAAE